jgi:hypothetical protein
MPASAGGSLGRWVVDGHSARKTVSFSWNGFRARV